MRVAPFTVANLLALQSLANSLLKGMTNFRTVIATFIASMLLAMYNNLLLLYCFFSGIAYFPILVLCVYLNRCVVTFLSPLIFSLK
jgi:hypothetical protein